MFHMCLFGLADNAISYLSENISSYAMNIALDEEVLDPRCLSTLVV